MSTDETLNETYYRNMHKKAKAFYEQNKEVLDKRPVRYVPAGFSFEMEKKKKKIKEKQQEFNKSKKWKK